MYVNLDTIFPIVAEDAHVLDWYERWLDELIAGYDMASFGTALIGTEATFRSILENPLASDGRRSGAMFGLYRLPRLTDPSRQTVLDAIDDPFAEVRLMAMRVIQKFSFPEAAAAFHLLIHDEALDVRVAAIEALTKLDIPWCDAVHPLLNDPDPVIVRTVLWALGRVNRLAYADLQPLLASDNGYIRAYAVAAFRDIPEFTDPEPIIEALGDSEPQVQLAAAKILSFLPLPALVPHLLRLFDSHPSLALSGAIIDALAAIKDRAALPMLIALTRHQEASLRYGALCALEAIGDRRAIPAIKALLAVELARPESEWPTYRIKEKAQDILRQFSWFETLKRWID